MNAVRDRLVHKRRIEAAKLAKRQCILGFLGNCQTTTTAPAPPATPSPVIETHTTTVQGSPVRETVTQTPPAPQAPPAAPAPAAVTVTTTQGRQAYTVTASQTIRVPARSSPPAAAAPPAQAVSSSPASAGAQVVTVPETLTTTVNGQSTILTTDLVITIPVSAEIASASSSASAPVATEYLVPIILLNGSVLTTALPMSAVQSLESASLVTDLGDGTLSQLPASLPTAASASTVSLPSVGPSLPGTVTATADPAYLTASPSSQAAESKAHSSGASTGLIAGCVVAGVAVAALVLLLAAWCFRRREAKKRRRANRALSDLYGTGAIYPFTDNRQSYAGSAHSPADEGYITHGVPPGSHRTESPIGSEFRSPASMYGRGPASELGRGHPSTDFLAVPARSPGSPRTPSSVGGEVGNAMLSPRSDAGRRITFQEAQPQRDSRLSRAFSFLRRDPTVPHEPPQMRPLNLPSRSAMTRRREPTPQPSGSEVDDGGPADQAWLDEVLDGSRSSDMHVPGHL